MDTINEVTWGNLTAGGSIPCLVANLVSILSFAVQYTLLLNVKSKANGEYCSNSKIFLANTIGAS